MARIIQPKKLADQFVHCGQCDCQLHYLDSWASDSGYLCADCAEAEIESIALELSDSHLEIELD